jgi:N-acylglucosamine 2-epimerase
MNNLSFKELLSFYEHHLFEEVMPFWVQHCIDWENGGINNIVKEDGTVVSTDKILWSQARALWTFSAIYNYLQPDPKWLDIAHNLAKFIMKHGRNANNEWVFRLHADGSIADHTRSVYVDAFVTYGLVEYYRAAGLQEAMDIIIENYNKVEPILNDHIKLPTAPLPIPKGFQAHGPYMIYALVFYEVGLLTGRNDILKRSLDISEIIMTQHVKMDKKCLLEYVLPGGKYINSDEGNTFLPGHTIESMWFLERIYNHFGKEDHVESALQVIRWSLEKGWDEEYGGIFLARHLYGGSPVWPKADSKVWWPATESLYALLRAYEISGEEWCMDWYWRIHQYAFDKYPNPKFGEWTQNLDRYGNAMAPVVEALPVKDPFHLPRALIYAILTLRKLAV